MDAARSRRIHHVAACPYAQLNRQDQSKYPGRIKAIEFPMSAALKGKTPMASVVEFWAMCIPAHARDKELAWSFIQAMSSQAVTLGAARNGNGPVRLSTFADPSFAAAQPMSSIEVKALKGACVPLPAFPEAARGPGDLRRGSATRRARTQRRERRHRLGDGAGQAAAACLTEAARSEWSCDAHAGGGRLLVGLPAEEFNRGIAMIAGTSPATRRRHRSNAETRRVGPYFGAMLPGLWLNEAGQSATGALVDHILDWHAEDRMLAHTDMP